MGDFFHGWRRKIGVVTMLMALAFMTLWIRGYCEGDFIGFQNFTRTYFGFELASDSYSLALNTVDWPQTTHDDSSQFLSMMKQAGCVLLTRRAQVPHWMLVIPLTLISAYLLLWKP
jgi:hypothetical protein